LISNKPVFEGPQVQLGAEESYQPVCSRCYEKFYDHGRDVSMPGTDLTMSG